MEEPRFEFRAFAENFGIVETRMRKLSRVDKIRESSEIYIVSKTNDKNNTKIRDNLMDIKVLISEEKGLEKWMPVVKSEFPLTREKILDEIFPAFMVSIPELKRDRYTLEQFISELIRPHRDLVLANVFKRRFGFQINNCIVEIAQLKINGARIDTAAVESVDAEAVIRTKKILGLDEYENVNYLKAIKRITGLLPLPD